MYTFARTIPLLTVLCLALSALGFAAGDASIYLIHGIPGRDLASDLNPGLPVDVLVNSETCAVHGLTFGNSSGPFTLPSGDYDVKISSANTLAPCTNATLAEATGSLSAGSAITLVATLDSTGSAALVNFADNLLSVKSGQARFTFAQAADAPALQVALTQQGVKNPAKSTFTIDPGAQNSVELPVGSYSLVITASGSETPLYSGTVFSDDQAVELCYIVGEASNNSVTVITRLIRDVY